MVISYIAGAGGNRFIHYLHGLNYKLDLRYDFRRAHNLQVINLIDLKYLEMDTPQVKLSNETIITTHTMNNDLIEQVLPGHKIYNIDTDLKRPLRRYVSLYGSDTANKFENYLDYCYSNIVWQHEYYKKYPADFANGEVITKGHEFFEFMDHYLESTTDKLFELAWSIYEEYGSNAPVIDIWNKIKDDYQQ